MNLLKIADVPATTISPATTVSDAVDVMMRNRVGAVAVVEQSLLRGIFTERDVMTRVVAPHLDPRETKVVDVMTDKVEAITVQTSAAEALKLMVERHFRHLPILGSDGQIKGMVSVRNLLQNRIEYLSHELDGLAAYLTADGPGG